MTTPLRIVLHPNSLSLHVLHRLGILEERLKGSDVRVEWVPIAGGARTPDYLAADLADFGGTGSTPPITGQGNGVPLVYAAASTPRDFGGIAVRDDSAIHEIADLKGKIVTHSGGSWHQTLISTALHRVWLKWSDIVPIDLPEPVSHERLLAGKVDAWASGELVGGNIAGARFIARTGTIFANRFIFFVRRDFAERHPELLEITVQAVDQAEHWIGQNPGDAAAHLQAALKRDSAEQWQALLTARKWGLVPIDQQIIDEQQAAADVLHGFGLIGRKIDVRDATLPKAVAVRRAA
jgi:sulfonate transport system substrate-binding protein